MMAQAQIAIGRNHRVLEITLTRPKVNAIDAATSIALGEAFQQLQDDDSLSVGIITSGVEGIFSAGWDLKAVADGETANDFQGAGGFAGLTEFWGLKKPVIAAINGLALGGGFELALAADMIVASEGAEFGFPEAKLGLVPDAGGVIRLSRRLPRAVATELLMTGRRVGAGELCRWGLINEIVPEARLLETARQLARRVAESAPLSLQAIKEIAGATYGATEEAAFQIMRNGGLKVYGSLYASEDAREGMSAFKEKRLPNWRAV